MCFPSGGGGRDNSVLAYQQKQDEEARAKEAAREQRIALGRQQIDQLFDKGNVLRAGTGITQQVRNPALDVPIVDDGAGNVDAKAFPPPATIEQKIDPQWDTGGTAFDQKFYDNRKQAYLNNYMPQLGDQFKKARETMAYALARAGLTRSSVAADQYTDLDKTRQIQEGTLGAQAEADVTNLRGQVEDARTGLIHDLNASADPAGTANTALARTQQIAGTPVSYSPLGDIFSGVASGIGNFVTGVRQANVTNLAGLNARVPRPTNQSGVSTKPS
jgi:hypothetical protein